MGTEARIIAVGKPARAEAAVETALRMLADLEARWSRFRPDSELTQINGGAGSAVRVSQQTAELVALAVEAWRTTAGLYDPTVLPALCRLGYDRSFETIIPRDGPILDDGPEPAPGCTGVEVDLDASTVRLPPGVSFDLGGIGKGRAADLIVARLLDDGVEGACVDLGGDVRVAGRAPDPEGWLIAVADPWDDDAEIAMLALADGAVTTSARTRRRWWFDGTEQHHLIDPVTGLPARSGLAAVTVVAAEAVWAEVVAKAAFVGGPDVGTSLIASSGAAGILVEDDHRVRRVGPVGRYVLESGVSPVNRGTRR